MECRKVSDELAVLILNMADCSRSERVYDRGLMCVDQYSNLSNTYNTLESVKLCCINPKRGDAHGLRKLYKNRICSVQMSFSEESIF